MRDVQQEAPSPGTARRARVVDMLRTYLRVLLSIQQAPVVDNLNTQSQHQTQLRCRW